MFRNFFWICVIQCAKSVSFFETQCIMQFNYSAPGRRAEYCDEHVCLYVSLWAYLLNHAFQSSPNVFLHITYGCLKQWRLRLLHAVLQSSSSSSETFLQYAKYFQFYGQRHILHNGPYGGMLIPLQQCCCSVQLQQCSDVAAASCTG